MLLVAPSAKKKGTDFRAPKQFLVSLQDGNQSYSILSPKVDREWIVDIQARHPWSAFDSDDNRMWEYRYALLDPVLNKSRRISFGLLWARFNRAQKIFYAFLAFDGETNNGGVWQFLFNAPELSLAALESMEEIGADQLARDYHAVLVEMAGKASTISDLRRAFQDQELSSRQRWVSFAKGYGTLASAAKIERYYFTVRCKRPLYRKMADYVEANLGLYADFTGSFDE